MAGEPGGRLGWGCAGSVGSPLPMGAANHTLGSSEVLLQSPTPHPFSQGETEAWTTAQLGLAQHAGLGGHPPPRPVVPVPTVLQPTAAPGMGCLRLIRSLHPAFVCF